MISMIFLVHLINLEADSTPRLLRFQALKMSSNVSFLLDSSNHFELMIYLSCLVVGCSIGIISMKLGFCSDIFDNLLHDFVELRIFCVTLQNQDYFLTLLTQHQGFKFISFFSGLFDLFQAGLASRNLSSLSSSVSLIEVTNQFQGIFDLASEIFK